MKQITVLAVLVFAGFAGKGIGERLSPDALAMLIGMVFMALIVWSVVWPIIELSHRAPSHQSQPPTTLVINRIEMQPREQPQARPERPQAYAIQPAWPAEAHDWKEW